MLFYSCWSALTQSNFKLAGSSCYPNHLIPEERKYNCNRWDLNLLQKTPSLTARPWLLRLGQVDSYKYNSSLSSLTGSLKCVNLELVPFTPLSLAKILPIPAANFNLSSSTQNLSKFRWSLPMGLQQRQMVELCLISDKQNVLLGTNWVLSHPGPVQPSKADGTPLKNIFLLWNRSLTKMRKDEATEGEQSQLGNHLD